MFGPWVAGGVGACVGSVCGKEGAGGIGGLFAVLALLGQFIWWIIMCVYTLRDSYTDVNGVPLFWAVGAGGRKTFN